MAASITKLTLQGPLKMTHFSLVVLCKQFLTDSLRVARRIHVVLPPEWPFPISPADINSALKTLKLEDDTLRTQLLEETI